MPFEFIKGLVDLSEKLGQSDLAQKLDQLALARARFPLREGPCRYSLSISHHTRAQVNREANLREWRLHPEAMKLECERVPVSVLTGDSCRPQTMWVWPGQELIGAGGRAKKGIFYKVVSLTPERITVEGNGETLTTTHETAVKCLRLTQCLTCASRQGLSLDGVRLLETSSHWFTWRRLYVGASRCTSSATLQVG